MNFDDSKIKFDMLNLIDEIIEYVKNEQPLVEDKVRPAIYTNKDGVSEAVLVHVSRKPKFDGAYICEHQDGSMKDIPSYYLRFTDGKKLFNSVVQSLKLSATNESNEK